MTTMQPAEQQRPRSDAALAVTLVLGNLFFWVCVANRYAEVPTASPYMVSQPEKIVLAEG
jgi:hypothetical protein